MLVRRDANLWGLLRGPMVLATAAGALLSAEDRRPPDWIALPLRVVGDVAVLAGSGPDLAPAHLPRLEARPSL